MRRPLPLAALASLAACALWPGHAAAASPGATEGNTVFADGFESGTTAAWNQTISPFPACNCYFSSDCPSGTFCNWGPGGPFTEDICNWRIPKPQGTPGAGCTDDVGAPGAICDGLCTASSTGLPFALEGRALIAEAVRLWSSAMLEPSASGGGPVDPKLAQRALDLPFDSPLTALLLGRQTTDVLVLAADPGFYDYFCHYENGHEDPAFFVDLSGDSCHLQAGQLAVEALIHEILEPGSGRGFLAAIPAHCPGWETMFSPRCAPGPGALDCFAERVEETARFLSAVERLPAMPLGSP